MFAPLRRVRGPDLAQAVEDVWLNRPGFDRQNLPLPGLPHADDPVVGVDERHRADLRGGGKRAGQQVKQSPCVGGVEPARRDHVAQKHHLTARGI